MKLKLLALAAIVLAPALLFGWPQPGEQAPSVYIADTAYVSHLIPDEYRGNVILLNFWQST
uniref:Redoxin domain-containing protein n=1 Tax=candidate division WOR-3 bacterium TaxID=2052148 RepID=A0A7C4G9S0_UNCW3